jgi:DNA-binding SARP family transcriptional activator
VRRRSSIPSRPGQAATATVALAAVAILWLLRPAWPQVGSLTSPLAITTAEQIMLCLAWLLGVCLALTILTREVRALIHRPTQAIPIPLGDAPRAAASAWRVLPRDAKRDWSGQSPYVLTISTPIANTSSPPPPATETPLARATSEENSQSVSISLLGPLVIGGLSKRIGRTATRELIAYLALHPHGAGRDELIEALWPGGDPESTRPRFWQSVTEARKALGDAWLHDGERYQLDRGKIRIDLDELDRLLAITDPEHEPVALEGAAALWRGEPLAGSDYPWADGEIRRLHATFLDLLVRVGHTRLANGDPRGALAAAEQAISLDDLHEPSWRLALQAEHSLGLRSSVTQRYEELAHTLDEELGLQPSHETRMMYRQLLGQS